MIVIIWIFNVLEWDVSDCSISAFIFVFVWFPWVFCGFVLGFCIQLCEDLFQRAGQNSDPDLTYSVEVSRLISVHLAESFCECLTTFLSTSRCPTWRSTVSGCGTCWTQSLRGLSGSGSTPSWVLTWRTCPNWLWLVSQTSGTWWTLATKLGQCVLNCFASAKACLHLTSLPSDAAVWNADGQHEMEEQSEKLSLCQCFVLFLNKYHISQTIIESRLL